MAASPTPCPTWCTEAACDGNHGGDMVSAASAISLATGRSIDLLVTPYQDVELPPIVGLAENDPDSRWAVELTPDGARALGEALRDVADLVDPQA